MNIKTTLAIMTIITVNSNATQYRLGFPNLAYIPDYIAGNSLTMEILLSNQWGCGVEYFGAGVHLFGGGTHYMAGYGVNGIKKWSYSPHSSAELKIGIGSLEYGYAGYPTPPGIVDDGSYTLYSPYLRVEPSYHLWWNFIGLKPFVMGQISRKGLDYGIGMGLEFGWES